MTTWFTSDLHFGHVNIIQYCDRPFAGVEKMNEALVERWNEVVADGDTVWVLGDVAMGRIAETLPLVGRLRGRAVMLTGNHDRCWAGNGPKAADWVQRYLDAGFAEVHQGTVAMTVGGHQVLACHFPYRGDSQEIDRYLDARPTDGGGWLLHGHVHEQWRQHGRMINVGCDAWDYRPVADATLAALIEAGPRDLDRLLACGA